jgi:nucleotide-binding universal stress UspA family protein
MNFKDILVHIDHRITCQARLNLAVRLAKEQGARLTGIYVVTHPYGAPAVRTPQQLAQDARDNFAAVATEAQIENAWLYVDTVSSGLDVPHAVNLHAHYHDLLIISQTDPDNNNYDIPSGLPEKAVLGSGRPVLIVPYTGQITTCGKRVMLAWRGGPESSRALHDALPLLRRAESVRVVSVQGRGGDEIYARHNADICEHLKRYGLPVSSEKLNAGSLSVGDLLLSRCADHGIDLLVMGAFSQTRRGHQVLGEVGTCLLESMTVPVLMSY